MKKRLPRSQAAFSLVEVALALGIAAFCMVTIFGLVPIGVNTNRASFEQTSAANVASAIAADLRATQQITPPADQTSPFYQIPVPGTPAAAATKTVLFVGLDGTPAGPINQNADPTKFPHYRVSIYFTSTGSAGSTSPVGNPNATAARILVTWPAMADANYQKSPSQYAGSFESFAGLVGNK